jgi:hypothetical protein
MSNSARALEASLGVTRRNGNRPHRGAYCGAALICREEVERHTIKERRRHNLMNEVAAIGLTASWAHWVVR